MKPLVLVALGGVALTGCNALFGLDPVEVGGEGGGSTSSSSETGATTGTDGTGSTSGSGSGGTSSSSSSSSSGSSSASSSSGGGAPPVCPTPWDGVEATLEMTTFTVPPGEASTFACVGADPQTCTFEANGVGHLRFFGEARVHEGQCFSIQFDGPPSSGDPEVQPYVSDGVGGHFYIGRPVVAATGLTWECRIPKDLALDTFGFQIEGASNDAISLQSASIRITSTEDCAATSPPDCQYGPADCTESGTVAFEDDDLSGWVLDPPLEDERAPTLTNLPGWSSCGAFRLVQPEEEVEAANGWSMAAPGGVLAQAPQAGECIRPRLRARGTSPVTLLFPTASGELRFEFDDLDERWSDDIGENEGSSTGCQLPAGFDATGVTLATGRVACGFHDIDRLDLGVYACGDTGIEEGECVIPVPR